MRAFHRKCLHRVRRNIFLAAACNLRGMFACYGIRTGIVNIMEIYIGLTGGSGGSNAAPPRKHFAFRTRCGAGGGVFSFFFCSRVPFFISRLRCKISFHIYYGNRVAPGTFTSAVLRADVYTSGIKSGRTFRFFPRNSLSFFSAETNITHEATEQKLFQRDIDL